MKHIFVYLIVDWIEVSRSAIQESLKSRIDRIDRRPQLVHSKSSHVEILLFNSSLGILSVEALRAAAVVFARRRCKPCPSFHVIAVESSFSQHEIARLLPKKNCQSSPSSSALVEDLLMSAEPKAIKWVSFGNSSNNTTNAGDSLTTSETKPIVASSREDLGLHEGRLPNSSSNSNSADGIRLGDCSGDGPPSGSTPGPSFGSDEVVWNKIKSRLQTLVKDPRQLRPSVEDGKSKLSLAKLIHAQMKPDGPELPIAEKDDYLPDKADVVVYQMIDSGLLGEGILPILAYCHDALMKPNAKVCIDFIILVK